MSLFSKKNPKHSPEPEVASPIESAAPEGDVTPPLDATTSLDAIAEGAVTAQLDAITEPAEGPEPAEDAPAAAQTTSFDALVSGYAASGLPDPGSAVELESPEGEGAADGSATAIADAAEAEAGEGKPRRRRGLAVGIAAGLAVLLGGGGAVAAIAHKTVEIDVDGTVQTVTTFSGDVEGVLAEQGIEVAEHDLVVPAQADALSEGAEVVIRTAREISFVVDGTTQPIWTTATTAGAAVADVSGAGRDISMAVSRSADGRPELQLPLASNGPVVIGVDGATQTVEIEGEADLEAVLTQAGITLGALDQVSVTAREDATAVLTITRVAVNQTTTTEAIPFETTERETDDMYEGESRVAQEGVDGVRTYTFSNRLVDGVIVSTKPVGNTVTTEPVEHIIEVGTAERPPPPPPPPAPTSGGSGSSGGSSGGSGGGSGSGGSGGGGGGGGSTVGGDVWARLAQCESGGNPTIVSSNGLYHGLYQFSVGTWQSLGGTGLPSQASPAEQTRLAQALQARSGWGQWPHCSSVLGLR